MNIRKRAILLSSAATLASLLQMQISGCTNNEDEPSPETILSPKNFPITKGLEQALESIKQAPMTSDQKLDICFSIAADLHNNVLLQAATQVNNSGHTTVKEKAVSSFADFTVATLGKNIATCNDAYPNSKITMATSEKVKAAEAETNATLRNAIQLKIVP